MKFTVVAVGSALVGASLAARAADNARDIINAWPKCVSDCFGPALTDSGCSDSDLDCGCNKYADVTFSLSSCVAVKVATEVCSLDDVTVVQSTGFCVDFTSDDLDNIQSAVDDIDDVSSTVPGITSTTDIPSTAGTTSSRDSITSAIATPTSTSSDDDNNGDSPSSSHHPNAGPRATPMALAGAAIAIAAMAL